MLKLLKQIVDGILAGLLIAIGGTVLLSCEDKIVGAVLFSVALLCICLLGYSLYTGKICYIADHPTRETFSVLLLGLLGNLIGTFACGRAIRFALPAVGEKALVMCEGKLEQTFPVTLIRAFFCGVLIYLAVEIYRRGKGIVGILFCIPVFIMSGFEHSIADMYYFAASGLVSLQGTGFLFTVLLGNSLGGLLIPLLGKIGGAKNEPAA